MDDRLALLEDLRVGKTTISIVTTYAIDFQFYETVVLRRLNAAGCEHHLVLVDAVRCGEALADPDRRPRLAGISYTVVPVYHRGAFHPKLIVRVGKKGSRVHVGSHNMTTAGFCGNAELTSAVSPPPAGGPVVHQALDAIASWLGQAADPIALQVLAAARKLVGAASHTGDDVLLLSTGGPNTAPLWSQLRDHLPTRPRRLTILGPFFDGKLEFVRHAMAELGVQDVVVAIDPEYALLRPSEAQGLDAKFVDARTVLASLGYPSSASLHAKAILVEGADRNVLISGSANPSAAAWLHQATNAEAVVVHRNVDDELVKRLGFAALQRAPEITVAQWGLLGARVAAEATRGVIHVAPALVATEAMGLITIRGVRERPDLVRAYLPEGAQRDIAAVWDQDVVRAVDASIDLGTCHLVEILGGRGGLAIVNHAHALSPQTGGANTRGELRSALAAITEDGTRIEEVLKIVERAIAEDSLDDAGPTMAAGSLSPATGDTGDEHVGEGGRSIPLDQVKRRKPRGRSVASGDLAVVIDLLIRRVGEGLPTAAVALTPEVEESELDPLENAARTQATTPVTDPEACLKACHSKLKRLTKRMIERLDHVMEAGTGGLRAVVQLAAVLGLLRWLLRIEPELRWLPMGKSLVPAGVRDDLFWSAGTHLGLAEPSLIDQVEQASPGGCQELSLALGLLGWLGREAGVDVRVLARHPDGDDLGMFHWTAILTAVLMRASLDEAASDLMDEAVMESRGRDREDWLAVHRRPGTAAALAASDPGGAPVLARRVERGDVVRIKMPNGKSRIAFAIDRDDTKVWVADAQVDEGRPILRSYVAPLDIDALS